MILSTGLEKMIFLWVLGEVLEPVLLVSYCLGITDLDPMPLNLIFERFLNPERISLPDFDIDFCQEKRPLVLDYITKKYGEECSSHVITYGRLSVRAAIRDVARVLGLSYSGIRSDC